MDRPDRQGRSLTGRAIENPGGHAVEQDLVSRERARLATVEEGATCAGSHGIRTRQGEVGTGQVQARQQGTGRELILH